MVRFYDERLPADCASGVALDKWLRRDETAAQSLRMNREQVLTRDPGGEVEAQFPKTLTVGDISFQLSYQFEPGGNRDGVTVTIPRALMNRVPRYRFEWLVPGSVEGQIDSHDQGLTQTTAQATRASTGCCRCIAGAPDSSRRTTVSCADPRN